MAFELTFRQIPPNAPSDELTALAEMATFTFCDTFRHYQKADIDHYIKESLSVEALALELQDPNNTFYFILFNEVRAGFFKWVHPSSTYLEHSQVRCQNPFLIQRFYLMPDYCGKGLASVALEFVTSFAKYQAGADFLYLSVWEKNYRAQSFYQKHGFRTIGSFGYPVGQEIDHEFLYGKRLL